MEKVVAGAHGAAGGYHAVASNICLSSRRNAGTHNHKYLLGAGKRPQPTQLSTSVVMGPGSRPGRRVDRIHQRTTPDVKPAFLRGGLMSFFRKQCAWRPIYPGRA